MSGTSITAITVTYNAGEFIEPFLGSMAELDTSGIDFKLIAIDNGSSDGTQDKLRAHPFDVTVIENDENNYARALNLGIADSDSEFVVVVNNDATVAPGWLQGFLAVFAQHPRAGAVQSKMFFSGQDLLNSVGVEEIEHYYFKDIGFEEKDSVRYANPALRDYVTGGSLMLRRQCLAEVGPWDEEFIMFMEDVDYSARCRAAGWELWFAPESILYHQYHGSSSQDLCEYFCTRNRFLFVAKHFPRELVDCIPTSHFYKKGEFDNLYRSLLHAMRKMCSHQDTAVVMAVLAQMQNQLSNYIGDVATHNFFCHLELILGQRRLRVGIYDHAGHFTGGGQRYVAEMAAIMQERYDVT
ncbi:MAG: glycosyltransferase family 2 protein, partial [Halioglobus sp.]|nr:glycosyltransferase family 2 protein [Halioglobus sp.]